MMLPAPFKPTRRRVVTGLTVLAALPIRWAGAVGGFTATIKEGPAGPAFDLTTISLPSLRPDERIRVDVINKLSAPIALGARGCDGIQALQPLLSRVIEPDKTGTLDLSFSQTGTFAIEAALLDDAPIRTKATMPVQVAEPAPPQADQDRTLLIEDSRVRVDGTVTPSGTDTRGAQTTYTANGGPNFTVQLRGNERLRLRLINGCQRIAIGLQFDDHDVRVIAIDSRPAEPFLARDRRVVLAAGSRVDVLIDATQPAGSTSAVQLFDGGGPRRIGQLVYADAAPARAQILPPAEALPEVPTKLELASALRLLIDLGGGDWPLAKDLINKRPPPLFRSKRGRTILLTLTNRAARATTFRVYGHHVRWLDRLDDGWKPFLLDTMLVDAGQTERVAFRADFSGDWLIENTPTDWSAPRRAQWFAVE